MFFFCNFKVPILLNIFFFVISSYFEYFTKEENNLKLHFFIILGIRRFVFKFNNAAKLFYVKKATLIYIAELCHRCSHYFIFICIRFCANCNFLQIFVDVTFILEYWRQLSKYSRDGESFDSKLRKYWNP